MIDISRAKAQFANFIKTYGDKIEKGIELKAAHTYRVLENSRKIAKDLNLSDEDINLAELIALLHDIGRFEEITILKRFDNVNFDHASYGVKMLFEDNLIRNFIQDRSYDEIIKTAISNHSKFAIESGINERCLLHSKIIRDADKLDNFWLKREIEAEIMFIGKVNSAYEIENSLLSDKVYENVIKRKCVDVSDRKTALDYYVCVIAFLFDLNFKQSIQIVKDNDYINGLIDRFEYKNLKTKERMERIRKVMNDFIDGKLKS